MLKFLMLLQLNVYPGLKGLKEMLGTVPAWIHYEERERVEVNYSDCRALDPSLWVEGAHCNEAGRHTDGCCDHWRHIRMEV
jgi:hypothetical protein